MPHSMPPLITLIVMPKPDDLIASWHDGLGGWVVIQNHRAVMKVMVLSVETSSGWLSKSLPIALPHAP